LIKKKDDTILQEDEEELVIINESNKTIFNEIKNIYDNAIESSKYKLNNTGDRDNMQFCPAISKRLLDFCKLIPCWSAIMIPIFPYGKLTRTSCSFESLFKDLKTIVFKHKTLPLKLDEFLKIHINSILGSMNILANKTKYTNNEKIIINNDVNENKVINEDQIAISEKSKRKHLSTYDDPTVLENWKGLGYEDEKRNMTQIYYTTTILAILKVEHLEFLKMEIFPIYEAFRLKTKCLQ